MQASRGGHAEIVAMLLKAGAEITPKTQWGMTATQFAAACHHHAIVKTLEEANTIREKGRSDQSAEEERLRRERMLGLLDEFRRKVGLMYPSVDDAFQAFDRKGRHVITRSGKWLERERERSRAEGGAARLKSRLCFLSSDFKQACSKIGIGHRLTDDQRRKLRENISMGSKTIKIEV